MTLIFDENSECIREGEDLFDCTKIQKNTRSMERKGNLKNQLLKDKSVD